MSKRLFYSDPYYILKIKNTFGYGGICHYNEIFHDIKQVLDNDMNIMCYRIKRNKNLYTLIFYWVFVQRMFIASWWKEIIFLSTFSISSFIEYTIMTIYEKCYLKYFKKQNKDDNNDAELVPLNSIDARE